MTRHSIIQRALIAGLLSALLTLSGCYASALTQGREQELERLVRHDCGSCHGLNLTGGLGPAFDFENLSNMPDEVMAEIIRDGIPNTPMSGWGPLLNDEEIDWIVAYLKREASDVD